MSSFVCDLLREAEPELSAQLAHPFVRALADGTLDEERFAFYIAQDAAFLADYGRALRNAAALAPERGQRERLERIARETAESELDLHRGEAARLGIDLARVEPAPATRAYGAFLTEPHPFGALVGALLPCLWGYAELGRRLAAEATAPRYARWLETYADEEFAREAGWFVGLAESCAADPGVAAELRDAFATSLRFEAAFWDAAWELESP